MNLYTIFVTSGLFLLIISVYFFITGRVKFSTVFILIGVTCISIGLYQGNHVNKEIKVHELKLTEFVSNYNNAVKIENGFPYFALHLKSFKKTIEKNDEINYTYELSKNETLYVTTTNSGNIKRILLKGEVLNEKEVFSEATVHKAFVIAGITNDVDHAADIIIYLMNETDGNKDYNEGYIKYNLKYNLEIGDDLTIYYN